MFHRKNSVEGSVFGSVKKRTLSESNNGGKTLSINSGKTENQRSASCGDETMAPAMLVETNSSVETKYNKEDVSEYIKLGKNTESENLQIVKIYKFTKITKIYKC